MRRAAHRDAAEPDIIKAHIAAGDSVRQIDAHNFADLVIGSKGITHLVEVKSRILVERKGRKPQVEEGKLTEGQKRFRDEWKGAPVHVAYTPEESLAAVGHSSAEIARALRLAGLSTAPAFTPAPCPACRIDPQTPCRHDGEEKGVAAGNQPPRRKNRRRVDEIVASREATDERQ
jgi:hypothetical protein